MRKLQEKKLRMERRQKKIQITFLNILKVSVEKLNVPDLEQSNLERKAQRQLYDMEMAQ